MADGLGFHRRTAWAVSLVGLGTLAVLSVATGPISNAARLNLGLTNAALLDTIAFDNRAITASLAGTVALVDDDGTAWIERRGQSFPVLATDSVHLVEHTGVLVVGRLRSDSRGRWLDAEAWTVVRGIPMMEPVGVQSEAVQD